MGLIPAHRPFCPIPRKNEVLTCRLRADLTWSKGKGRGLSAHLGNKFDQRDGQADNANGHDPQLFVEGGKLLGHLGSHGRHIGSLSR